MFGAIEAGGAKFVCAVGTGPDDLAITRSFRPRLQNLRSLGPLPFLNEQQAAGCTQLASGRLGRSISVRRHHSHGTSPWCLLITVKTRAPRRAVNKGMQSRKTAQNLQSGWREIVPNP